MSGETNMPCSAAEEGVHEHCCLHSIIYGEHRGNEVCCWCGDIYTVVFETPEHGPHTANTQPVPKKMRWVKL